ncbi:MAG: hypothetical protein M1823_000822 [Watsoniomyces obsoletus]|nr:MAG: hypothetical protein M1823_000822 [Watsoniomyces obsoletus]
MTFLILALLVLLLLMLVTHICQPRIKGWLALLHKLADPMTYPGSIAGETRKQFNFDPDDGPMHDDNLVLDDAISDSSETELWTPRGVEEASGYGASRVISSVRSSLIRAATMWDAVRRGGTQGLDRAVDRVVQSIESVTGVNKADRGCGEEFEIVA